MKRKVLWAVLVIFGIGILFTRTIIMIYEGALEILQWWVAGLLIIESILDLASISLAAMLIFWFGKFRVLILWRIVLTAILVHVIRVGVFVLGRIGPWINFDVRPEHRALHYTRWDWNDVYLASVLTVLALVGVAIIWHYRKDLKIV